MILRSGPFNELLKGEVQDFEGQTEVESRSNCDDVIINLIFLKR